MRLPAPACLCCLFVIALGTLGTAAADGTFTTGPLIDTFGPAATVPDVAPIPPDMHLRVRFDVSAGAEDGELNRHFVTAARFLNMHARTGVEAHRMHLAVVIHGRAVFDVLAATEEATSSEHARDNGALVAALREQGVRFYVCGQSAAYYEVTADQLLPGVEMSLSAMTAHALLAAENYELNPF